ncbi:MAG TPA: flagellar hook-basal body complex protein FliE [Bryobacteraceae bacterium]|nr:flagellar hook-basal body complex protein FliE [Bryobacteraceae bacterium]
MPITPIHAPSALPPLQPLDKPQGGGFQNVLSEAMGRVEQFQQNSQASIDKFLSGEDEEVHKVALATQETQMAFDLFLQMRNKVISAYQEVMRMQM